MAKPSWVTKPLALVADSPSEVTWADGRPQSVQRKYVVEVEIPSAQNTTALKEAWFLTNVEGAKMPTTVNDDTSPFYGAPLPGTAHPQHRYLRALSYRVTVPGYLSRRVYLTVTYELPQPTAQNQTDNGQSYVPFGSWGVQVGWSAAKLAGMDYRGKPLMTVAGEVVNVQCNVVVYTLTRSIKQTSSSIQAPSINASASSVAGFVIPKHCGLRSQTNVENTGQDAAEYPRILTDQIIYIPRLVSVTDGVIVNAGEGIATLADVGSHDVLVLHQGYREKVNGKVDLVSYRDSASGKKMTIHALSVLDADGKHVEPDVNGVVTPYYLAFQIYPDSEW